MTFEALCWLFIFQIQICTKGFLRLMVELRIVLCQDAACLLQQYPTYFLWQYPPFSTAEFTAWAVGYMAIINYEEGAMPGFTQAR